MSSTFLDLTNVLLDEVNEVRLTSVTFSDARNIQRYAKECINKAYLDLHKDNSDWPWLSTAAPQDNYFGNTYIDTVAGTRWYLLKSTSTSVDEDYGYVDFAKMTLTEEGVAGKTAPYDIVSLQPISLTDWHAYYSVREAKDKSDSANYGLPRRVMKSADGRRFGLSPIPEGEYRIYFQAYDQITELSLYSDICKVPIQYENVLLDRARYYIWKFKDSEDQSQDANRSYNAGLRKMIENFSPTPARMTDDRRVFV